MGDGNAPIVLRMFVELRLADCPVLRPRCPWLPPGPAGVLVGGRDRWVRIGLSPRLANELLSAAAAAGVAVRHGSTLLEP